MSDAPAVLCVHAVDTVGEEGVLVHSAVCSELRCRPVHVVSSVLAAGPAGIDLLEGIPLALLGQQLESVLREHRPAAALTGIVRDAKQAELLGAVFQEFAVPNVVVAPVARVGRTRILDEGTLEAMRRALFPCARVVVIRAGDLRELAGESGQDIEALHRVVRTLRSQGARAALVTGAVWRGRVLDFLDDEGRVSVFDASRLTAPRVPGLSGAHPSALSAHLALGADLQRSADAAQRYITVRLRRGE